MNTYDNSNDISGLDWQTAFNRSSSAPSFRETEGMTKAADSFYDGQIHTVDAVFCEGYLRGLNYALRILQQEIRIPTTTYKKAYKNLGHSINLKRESLLAEHGVSLDDDEALYSSTPFIDELDKKGGAVIMDNNQTAFDIDELYFKANNDMAVILNMVRIASLSKKKKGKLLAAIEQKILDTMGGYIDSVDDEDLQLNMCEATLPINYEGSDYADDEDGFIEASVDGILAEYERKKSEKEVSDNAH